MRVFTAQGSPGSAFQAQITYNPGTEELAAVLARYSGVDSIADPTGENINGEAGACSGGTDNKNSQLTLTSTVGGSVHAIGVATGRRNVTSTAAGYTAIATATSGSGSTANKIYAYDKSFNPGTTEQFTATINQNTDWSTGGVVLVPAAGGGGGGTYYVLSRDSDTQVTIQGTGATTHSNETYTIARAYNTLQAWEDDREGDLVTDNRGEIGVCYNDGAFTAPLTISGSTTDADRYLVLTVAAGQRHDGTWNSGARIDATGGLGADCIRVEDEYTQIEWIEIGNVQDANHGIAFTSSPVADNGSVSQVLVHDVWQSSNAGVWVQSDGVVIRNCFFAEAGTYAILFKAGSTGTVENCTLYGWSGAGYGVADEVGATVSVRNTIAVNHGSADFELIATISYFGYNMYNTVSGFSPAAYQGGNQSPPASLNDLFVNTAATGRDLHLDPSDHLAVNTGLDLSATFSDDIDGEVRSGKGWDIGADELPLTRKMLTWEEVSP